VKRKIHARGLDAVRAHDGCSFSWPLTLEPTRESRFVAAVSKPQEQIVSVLFLFLRHSA